MKPSGSNIRRHKGILSNRLRFSIYLALKRVMDLVLGGLLAIIALPILIICAVAVRIEGPGPIFFLQDRTGKSGRRFKMYKLRTMVHDADDLKEKYQHLNVHSYPDFKIPEDPRVTRVGRFLRKTSLDELPQLFNVIRGDMSLVGPRPTSFKASNYDIWHTARLEVIPGITGLWQISGRSNVGFDDRARLDVDYIRNRSLWLDLKILFRTFSSVIKRDGA
ncbi:MAG: sugar transferase [Gammaproteobacteria bacterium]